MKISICSDLHLDMGVSAMYDAFDDNTEVLVIAGDLVEIGVLKGKKNLRRKEVEFFLCYVSERFDRVIYVLGNHEHWNNNIYFTLRNMKTIIAKLGLANIIVLENETYHYKDVAFFGATLWTSCRNGNPLAMNLIQGEMNDYQRITVTDAYLEDRKLIVDDTIGLHLRTMKHLTDFAELETDATKVLVTHHAPSFMSIHGDFKGKALNDAYATELFDLLYDSGIKLAIHGHIHDSCDYNINRTRVVAQPRGYYGYEQCAYGYRVKTIEV